MIPDGLPVSRARNAMRDHANGAGHRAPASERVGESEGQRPSDNYEAPHERACRGARRGEAPRIIQFLSIRDLTSHELETCLDLAASLKQARRTQRSHEMPLVGRHVALLFEKPSLRTRSTFTIAVRELGGDVIEPPADVVFGGRETIEDVARNLERWVFGLVMRTFAQSKLERLAAAAPALRVVNALTDQEHPCQALADCQTLLERFGSLDGRKVAFVGDGNNVAASLAQAVAMLGGTLVVASPDRYELPQAVCEGVRKMARFGGGLELTSDPHRAVEGVCAVYTDVWTSMGQETEAAARDEIFRPYQVNGALMAHAPKDAVFMHCLPAHRGDEVTDEVMDSPACVAFDQSENRLHSQKALLALLSS